MLNMNNKKKIILTVTYTSVVIFALYWMFWLVFYFDATMDGPILMDFSNAYILFEHNYLVPIQIFGITITLSILTFRLYFKFRKRSMISRKYLILVLLSTLPFWYLALCNLHSIITYFDILYR